MMRTLLLEQGVRARLLCYPDGERRLTNLLHLSELLHTMCAENKLGITGTLKLFAEQIQNPDATLSEQYEQRLESDEKAVRIVTVHKSKGLEYPIVFCPFIWSDAESGKDKSVIFHENGQLTLDLEELEVHRETQHRESLAEKMRLLYVALTRAKHRCYLIWGDFRFGRRSAPAYLFGVSKGGDPLGELRRRSRNLTGAQVRREVEVSLGSEATVEITDLPNIAAQRYKPERAPSVELRPRVFNQAINRTSGITSFSGLVHGQEVAPESPDYDSAQPSQADERQAEVETPVAGIFAFPHGTRPGTCLHQIFQLLDYSNLESMPGLVSRSLRAFSIRDFDEVVCEMVRKTVTVPLEPDRPDFTLSGIKAPGRLQEVEFYFPINAVTPAKIARVFAEQKEHLGRIIPSTVDRLQFRPMSGFMKGFIDLVFEHEDKFYLVDWKSNWLGSTLEAYAHAAIEAEMTRGFYLLQLSIYTVALHRFLRSRKPGYDYEKHFGGAYYMFLRGIEPERPEFGVYRKRLSADFVEKLSESFAQ
jgi:exodeoxyribonuclease V beta subunit